MDKKKHNLKQLISFIEQLLQEEGNDWFHDELALLISKHIITERDTTIKLAAVTVKELGSIDKYIENGLIPLIDYDDIEDHAVRLALVRDCVEMGKARLSQFDQVQSFPEFCKYAFFQVEQLINYYYHLRFKGDVPAALAFLKRLYPTSQQLKNTASVASVNFATKLFALRKDGVLVSAVVSPLNHLARIRNEVLHRTSESEEPFELLAERYAQVDWQAKDKDWDVINEYNYRLFKREEDYNKVMQSVTQLKQVLLYHLSR